MILISDLLIWWHEKRRHSLTWKAIPGSQGYFFVDCSCGREWVI